MFQRRILFAIMVPVIAIGVGIAALSYYLLVTPLVAWLTDQAEHHLIHASDMAVAICDERFSDLVDLRLENDEEMNKALAEEALSEIMNLHNSLPQLELIVVSNTNKVLGATFAVPENTRLDMTLDVPGNAVVHTSLLGQPARINHRYFPFWRWHILSVIFDKDFTVASDRATRVVTIGTFGVLLVVLASISLLFYLRVKRPLGMIISATQGVARGELKPVPVKHPDEIGQVTLAFNNMVTSLEEEKMKTRQMMSELRDSEEHYRVLTENSLALVGMVQKGRFIYANQCALDTFHYTSDELLGFKAAHIVHPHDRSRVFNKVKDIESGLLPRSHLEFRCLNRSGEALWLESIATLIMVKEQHAVLIHAIDVTLRKQESKKRKGLEEKLARAQKMEAIGLLAGGVAHDLNNILGGLVSYPELLLMDLPRDSRFRQPLTVIHKSGLRAAAIVQDLLTLSRRGVAVAEIISLEAIVREYLNSPEHEKLKSFHPDVCFETRLEPSAQPISGSTVHLSKCLMNLVSNAAEAMPEGGTVTIGTAGKVLAEPLQGYESVASGTYTILSVVDTGVGVTKKDLKHIFEPFYSKKVMGRSGTGLGMAVVWGTAKDHGGFIDISSTPGRGTRVDLYFPTAPALHPESQDTMDQPIPMSGHETILVVDDVEEQLLIARQILSQLGYEVYTVSSGEEAVAFLQSRKIDLVVLDMIMDPGMDGLETYRRIMQLHPGQKAIITSGYSETERVIEAQRLGVGAYVKKPYVVKTLGRAVRNELDRWQVSP